MASFNLGRWVMYATLAFLHFAAKLMGTSSGTPPLSLSLSSKRYVLEAQFEEGFARGEVMVLRGSEIREMGVWKRNVKHARADVRVGWLRSRSTTLGLPGCVIYVWLLRAVVFLKERNAKAQRIARASQGGGQ